MRQLNQICSTKVNAMEELNVNTSLYDTLEFQSHSEDNEICLFVNNFRSPENQVPDNENLLLLKFSENLKFKISNDNMKHTIEIFKTNKNDFFGTVARFHLPCVRAYYQNNNVYITPSCISAMMTGINIEYKYFAGAKDPVGILNKYRMRGFSTLLSEKELEHFKEYNSKIDVGGMFHTLPNETTLGYKDLNDKIYRPKYYNKEKLPLNIYKNLSTFYIKTKEDLKKHYENKYKYKPSLYLDMFNYKFINNNGSIEPFDYSILKAYAKDYFH